MINCNPETVSTDFDISDRLYFEALTLEDVLAITDVEKPKGIIVDYGGQTPLKLARALEKAGLPILGTSPDSIDRAEDRERFQEVAKLTNLLQPANGTVKSESEALIVANEIGYPLVVRPLLCFGRPRYGDKFIVMKSLNIIYKRQLKSQMMHRFYLIVF